MNLNKNIARAMAAAMLLGSLAPFSSALAAHETTYKWGADDRATWGSGTPSTASGTNDVVINAQVDPSLTFDVTTQADCSTGMNAGKTAYSTNTYVVDLGHLNGSNSYTSMSGVNSVPFICTLVNTNATNGVVVSMTSANHGLLSASTDRIESVSDATATTGATTPNYGVWSAAKGQNTSIVPTPGVVEYLLTQTAASAVFGVTAAPKTVWDSTGDATAAAYHALGVSVAVTATTPAHQDYTDTLTFVATATF